MIPFKVDRNLMNSTDPVSHLEEPSGAYILRFSRFPLGASSALCRIACNQPGIYVWYKCYDYPQGYDEFCESLFADSSSPKFISREGEIKPYFKIKVSSSGNISEGKHLRISESLRSDRFRQRLGKTLTQMSMFQCPLYIGKSRDLRSRIQQHLSLGGALRQRLEEHQIPIERTMLLIIPMDEQGDIDDIEEDLYEEIFSRLLNPLFNIRLG